MGTKVKAGRLQAYRKDDGIFKWESQAKRWGWGWVRGQIRIVPLPTQLLFSLM